MRLVPQFWQFWQSDLQGKPNPLLAPVIAWGIAAVRRRRSARPQSANTGRSL